MNIGRGNELRFESWGLSAERDENSEPFLKEQQSQSLISQSAKLKIKHLTQMASNYGDLSRQLELGVQTFFLFFSSRQITEWKKKGGFKRSLRRRGRCGKLDANGKHSGRLPKQKYPRLPLSVLSSGLCRGRSLQVKFQLSDAAPKARWVDGRSQGDSFGFRMKEEAVTG